MAKLYALLLILLVACGAGAAQAQPTSSAERLQAVAAQARLRLIAGQPEILDGLAGRTGALATDGLTPAGRPLFAQFIAGSVQYVSVRSGQATTAWFNPLADGWVVGLWTAEGDTWRLTAVGIASTRDLAPAATGAWNRRAPTLAGALAAQGRQGQAVFRDIAAGRFDTRLRDRAASTAALRLLLANTRDQVARLAALQRLDGYRDFVGVVDDSVRARTQEIAGDPQIQAQILALPSETRLTLHPVMAFSRRDGETVAVQSPMAPSLIFIVHFLPSSTAARPRAVRIETVDLFQGDA